MESLIGKGGAGEVYKILYKGSPFALKIVQAKSLADDPVEVTHLLNEHRFLSLLKHPNVVDVCESGVATGGLFWFRMELLEGETLRAKLLRPGQLTISEALTIIQYTAYAVYQCHAINAVHRDVKPENVFITQEHLVKLLDFGIAKLQGGPNTRPGHVTGTPAYMAPEQIRGERPTFEMDVYALGIMTYEVLAKVHPFGAKALGGLHAIYNCHFHEIPRSLTDLGVPEEIAGVVAKAMEKDPRKRYPNALEFINALASACRTVSAKKWAAAVKAKEPARKGEAAAARRAVETADRGAKVLVLPIPNRALRDEVRSADVVRANASGDGPYRVDTARLPASVTTTLPLQREVSSGVERDPRAAGRDEGRAATHNDASCDGWSSKACGSETARCAELPASAVRARHSEAGEARSRSVSEVRAGEIAGGAGTGSKWGRRAAFGVSYACVLSVGFGIGLRLSAAPSAQPGGACASSGPRSASDGRDLQPTPAPPRETAAAAVAAPVTESATAPVSPPTIVTTATRKAPSPLPLRSPRAPLAKPKAREANARLFD